MTGGSAEPEAGREPGPSLEQRLLDIAVYAPVGLVAAVGETLPRLIADGRRRLGPGVASAQVVGRFATDAGYGLLCRRLEGLRRLGVREPEPAATPAHGTPEETHGTPGTPEERRGGGATREETGVARRPVETTGGSSPEGGPTPAVDALAIPGFASLSASQVVQRLDGLTEGELRELRAFEAGTRHRRTILNRVDQLLGT